MKMLTCNDCNMECEITDEEAITGTCLICGETNVVIV